MQELFNHSNVDEVRSKLVNGLNYPFVSCTISSLGGKENMSMLLTISKNARENWHFGILENSEYLKLHISNKGKVEGFSGSLKLRSFTASNIDKVISNINKLNNKG